MQFYEKLNFLLTLTGTSNRMLAHELQVDPSLISRLRTGTRGLPRNREQIKAMSLFFVKRCTTEYQRQTLFEMIGMKHSLSIKQEQLSEVVNYWLCGNTEEAGGLMKSLEVFDLKSMTDTPAPEADTLNAGNIIYYGNEGKRAAARAFYQYLSALQCPATIYVLADEPDEWLFEEPEFSWALPDWGLHLLHEGFKICHIIPPFSSVDQSFESISRWLPLYMHGQLSTYYYPRLRDNVYRRTLLVVPGEIAMVSGSIINQSPGSATLLTTDRRLSQSYWREFQSYLKLCRPMHTTVTAPAKLIQSFRQFLAFNGSRIQKVTSLSAETMPPELIRHFTMLSDDAGKLGHLYHQEMELVESSPEKYEFIDIAYLADAREVRAGRVPVLLSFGVNSQPLSYTPETYILHLKNILRLMETCTNYHFVPFNTLTKRDGILMVKNGQKALLVRQAPPLTVYEIIQPDAVQLCQEYLNRIAGRIGYNGSCRKKIISLLRSRIQELQA